MRLLKDLSLAVFFTAAGVALATVANRYDVERVVNIASIECSKRVVDAQIKQGEAAEHAYNVGKQEMAEAILQRCATDGKIALVEGAVLQCSIRGVL